MIEAASREYPIMLRYLTNEKTEKVINENQEVEYVTDGDVF